MEKDKRKFGGKCENNPIAFSPAKPINTVQFYSYYLIKSIFVLRATKRRLIAQELTEKFTLLHECKNDIFCTQDKNQPMKLRDQVGPFSTRANVAFKRALGLKEALVPSFMHTFALVQKRTNFCTSCINSYFIVFIVIFYVQ